jgi:hypothetical protein
MAGDYRHPELGFTIALPPGSEVRQDAAPGLALVALDPEQRGPFRANLVVTVEELSGRFDDVGAYTDASIADQERALDAYRLIDRTTATLRGGEGTRTLGHHDADGMAVAVDQWRVLDGERGYTITASCWALEYDALADAFAEAAESFAP